ncbi:hypothetical protein DH2020_039582 [Rehmannia glutinosa]|uniref:Uncharacterized protein n=1 Tax=Rehmannia glutinosa TaxID=99300 RepID=A0ABR0UWK5_REHGL
MAFFKNGQYLVKSGYRISLNGDNQDRRVVSSMWKKLWKLKVPPKVKHFVWRVCKDSIPTHSNLSRRHVEVDCHCVLCRVDYETAWHVFLECKISKECWDKAGLKELIAVWSVNVESMKEFVENVLSHQDEWIVAKTLMMLWSQWKERNEVLWNNKCSSSIGIISTAVSMLSNWCTANSVCSYGDAPDFFQQQPGLNWFGTTANSSYGGAADSVQQHPSRWKPAEFPFFKCNVDAALSRHKNSTGIAMVVRDDNGEFVVARTVVFQGLYEVREAEAIGIREALSWTKNLGFQQLIIETDAKYVVDGLVSLEPGISEFDNILKECQILLQSEPAFSVTFVHRNGNRVAHALAKEAFSFDSPFVWSSPPLVF